MLTLDQKIDPKRVLSSLLGSYLREITFLNQMSVFSRNWNHHWHCREETESVQTVTVIIFWNFAMF